jgi:hypothetical protein
MFFKGSRYAGVGDAFLTDARGRVVRYKKIRFIPEARGQLPHIFDASERLDIIADRYYRAADRYWRICDANGCMHPDELEAEPGRVLLIPPSEG